MIETFAVALPHGITLSCRAAGAAEAPLLVFLHGFPEAAFVWDELLLHFADRYRCVAPNLRGFEQSSAPAEVEAYRAKHLMADIEALAAHCNRAAGRAADAPLAALVAHDWGGAVAWNFAVQRRALLERLVIVNSPHPATFLRELQHSPAQQAASAYMNFLCRPDAAALLAANDFARLWPFLTMHGDAAPPGGGWLTDAVRSQYRDVWSAGLQGGLNYYRASPLRPPTPGDDSLMTLRFPPEFVTVRVPTLVLWGEGDVALLPALLDGLEAYVPKMRLVRVPDASHWIVHEQPALVAREIEVALAS
jgi:epoxide hydrolase 4